MPTQLSATTVAAQPRLVAVIDIGSSAIRIVVAEMLTDGNWKILDHAERSVRLGHDVFLTGTISRESMRQSLQILNRFREMLSAWQLGALEVRTVATSAIREARNRDQFVDRVVLRTGFNVQIIEGVETNHLTFSAVRHALEDRWNRMRRGNIFIMEVGGGSTEIMLLRRGEMVSSHSLHLGTVRIQHQLPRSQSSQGALSKLLRDTILTNVRQLNNELPTANIRQFVALGGEIRLAARLAGKQVDNRYAVITKAEFAAFTRSLMTLTVERTVARLGISYDEAEPLLPALLIFRHFLDATAAVEIIVPLASIREGLLLTLAKDPSGRVQGEFQEQIRASALALGQKYFFERNHAERVTAHALYLFDHLASEHGLDIHSRLLLEVAAILHDIGKYINVSGHHKHAEYIVQSSEVFGLGMHDIRIISNVVRYHRKALPSRAHGNFTSLPREDRLTVMKLAALLRVADALDTSHTESVLSIELEKGPEEFVLRCRSHGSIAAEQHSLSIKGNLFEEVFGVGIRLESSGL